MEQYTIEVQGLNTYRVYECLCNEMLDTVAVGMIQNNSIPGLLPLQVLHMDNTCSLKFNISSKVTLKQFLNGVVGKERFIRVIFNIVETLLGMEEYLLDVGCLQFCTEDIYVNVSTLDTEMLYYPVLGQEQQLNLNGFLKEILFSTEFDRSENCDYVVSFLHFLNKNKETDIVELKKMIEGFLVQKNAENKQQRVPVTPTVREQTPVPASTQATSQPSAPVLMPVPSLASTPIVEKPAQKQAAPIQMPTGKTKPEKKGMFGKKKKEKKQTASIGIEIPGMAPVRETPVQPIAVKPIEVQPMEGQPTKANPIEVRPVAPLTNFGETTVLQAPAVGETTVLGMDMTESVSRPLQPILERKRTQETIPITKDCFRLGKEQQYVDYYIADNTAVSRSHADIVKKGEDYYITDNNSLNHTFVNGLQVSTQNPQILKDGDLVTLANEEFVYKLLN